MYDYVIVGAGSAGCVMAHRLSEDPAVRVLLLEAGGQGRHPALSIPKGLKFALRSRRLSWSYQTIPFGSDGHREEWPRGRALGGTSAVNGMMWNRGSAADFDAIEDLGNPGWGWDSMLAAYRQIEAHELGASEMRGGDGPLHICMPPEPEPTCERLFKAAAQVGLLPVEDTNSSDGERIGYTPATIKQGRRVSSAVAFLNPIRDRPNLDVITGTRVTELLFQGDRCVGVAGVHRGQVRRFSAAREVILSLGSIATPQLLELSGIGSPSVLARAGVPVRVASPNVGERLREHRAVAAQWRIAGGNGYNELLNTLPRQLLAGMRYLANRRGPLAAPAYDVMGFFATEAAAERPDAMLLFAPFSVVKDRPIAKLALEPQAGFNFVGYPLRPESLGRTHIVSADPLSVPEIDPGYLTAQRDAHVTVALLRKMRELVAQPPLADLVIKEVFPGKQVQSFDDVIDAALVGGSTGYHAIGTCAMGPHDTDVVDAELRVRGVESLRIVDGSILPVMPAGNTNAPIMATAWHAADVMARAGSREAARL